MDLDDFISILGKSSGRENQSLVAEASTSLEFDIENGTKTDSEGTPFSPEPLSLDPESFWGRLPEKPEEKKSSSLEAHIPQVSAILPKKLGKFPLWSGEEDLLELLEEIYKKASPAGMMIFLGERK